VFRPVVAEPDTAKEVVNVLKAEPLKGVSRVSMVLVDALIPNLSAV